MDLLWDRPAEEADHPVHGNQRGQSEADSADQMPTRMTADGAAVYPLTEAAALEVEFS